MMTNNSKKNDVAARKGTEINFSIFPNRNKEQSDALLPGYTCRKILGGYQLGF